MSTFTGFHTGSVARYQRTFPQLGTIPDAWGDPNADAWSSGPSSPTSQQEETFDVVRYEGMGRVPIQSVLLKHEARKVIQQFDKAEVYRDFVVGPSEVEFIDDHEKDKSILTKIGSHEWKEKVIWIAQKGLNRADIYDTLEKEADTMRDLETDIPLNPFAISRIVTSKETLTKLKDLCPNIVSTSTKYDPLRRVQCRFSERDSEKAETFQRLTRQFNQLNKIKDEGDVVFTVPYADYFLWKSVNGKTRVKFDGAESWLALLRPDQVKIMNDDPYNVVPSSSFIPDSCRILRKVSPWDYKILQKKGVKLACRGYYIAEFRDRKDAAELVSEKMILPCPAQLMDGAHHPSEFVEEVSAKLRWRTVAKRKEICVLLHNESQIKHALAALDGNDITARERDQKKNETGHLTITYLPRMFASEEHIRTFICRVLLENGILVRSLTFQRHFSKYKDGTLRCIPHSKKLSSVCNRLVLVAQDLNLWTKEMDKRYPPEYVTDTEYWTLKMDKNVSESPDREETMSIEFPVFSIGYRLVEKMAENMPNVQYLSFGFNESFVPTIEPLYRILLKCPRNIRYALDEEFKKLDQQLRSESENKVWERSVDEEWHGSSQSCYAFLRLTDDRSADNDEVIGVEGWPKKDVQDVCLKLRKLMEWRVLDVDDHLFYGYGEAFVYHVERELNHRIVVDIDKFSRKLRVIGHRDAIAKAIEYFAHWKTQMMQTNLVVAEPRYFNVMRKIIGQAEVFADLKSMVKSLKKGENHMLSFEGTIEQFHGLQGLFDEINEVLSEEGCEFVDQSVHVPTCPVCTDMVIYDFHRLDKCGHLYCRPCLNLMLSSHLNDVNTEPLKCCMKNCGELISPFDYKFLVLGGSRRQKVLDYLKTEKLFKKCASNVVKNKKLRLAHCSTPDCIGLLAGGDRGTRTKCGTCDLTVCANCLREPHDEHTCEEYARLVTDVDWSLKEYVKKHPDSKYFRRCPNANCDAMIQKDGGCNHVHCQYCGIDFCWICEFKTRGDSGIYKHMQTEHGGTGGGWEIVDNRVIHAPDEDVDVGIQRMLLG